MKSQSTYCRHQDAILRMRRRLPFGFLVMERSIRLVSLATQRYLSEIISVARNYNKMRRESEKTNDVSLPAGDYP